MKQMLLLTCLMLALAASVALAGGVNIAWGTLCYTEYSAASTTFACDVNGSAGNRTMTVSFMPDSDMPDMFALEWTILGESDAAALPDWWKLGAAPDCRAGRAAFNSDYTTVETETCVDWTAGAGYDATNYTWDTNRVHITMGTAIDASTPYAAVVGQEYYAGGVTILNGKTVGTEACTGCSIGMTLALFRFTVAGLDGRRDRFFDPMEGGNQALCWNNPQADGEIACIDGVPARNTTWGQVKSLYR